MARPGPSIRKRNGRDPGAERARARLERRHALHLRRAFAKLLHIVVPARSTVRSLSVDGAIRRLHDRQGIVRDALAGMLTDAVLLGVAHGWDDAERAMGVKTNAVLGVALLGAGAPLRDVKRALTLGHNAVLRVTWDLVHAAALAWVTSGNTPAGLPDWGMGYGGVNSLTAQIVRASETQLRSMLAEWIANGEPLERLIQRVESVTFSRRRANLIAVTEVTRAYAVGNILAWQQGGVIRSHRWNTVRDEIVCPVCAPLSGAMSPVGQPFRLPDGRTVSPPPAHPACRCWLSAVVE